MKVINYVGSEGDTIIIEQPTDIYLLLDWCQNKMIENQEVEKAEVNKQKWENDINFLDKLMNHTENEGFGNANDEINY